MKEEPKYIARRRQLVSELKIKGIRDEKVLRAIGCVPRQCFMTDTLIEFAYHDKAYPIGAGQTISQPYTVAMQTELLDIQDSDKILEIGTGSGYQAAVIVSCGATLYTIERQKTLYDITQRRLNQLGYPANCKFGDGFAGWQEEAPFDKIIITAGASEMPQTLLRQLKIGGVMVIPYKQNGQLEMWRITRLTETEFNRKNFGVCAFVPMLKGVEK